MSRLLAQTNIVFSTHEQVLVDFTDVFSATYPAYEILCENINGTNDNTYINANLINSSGSVLSDSNYTWKEAQIRDSGTTQTSSIGQAAAMWSIGRPSGASNGKYAGIIKFQLISPFESNSFTQFISRTTHWSGTSGRHGMWAGNYKNAVSCTGIRFSTPANTSSAWYNFNGGRISIYGIGGS